MKSIYKSMFMVALGMAYSMQLYAHGGLSLAEDMCKLTVGPYTMHFTGYQPESTQEQEFCEDIPMIGRTVVALDYINEELRTMTTEVRIIRDTGSEENLDAVTIFHLPPQVYSNGSVTFEHGFTEAGKFVGLVTVRGEKEEYVSRFPFSVGAGGKSNLPYIIGVIVLAAVGAIFFMRSKKNKTEAA
ncbi:hypothetical protein R2Q26_14675 [Nitrosomonas sp. Is37]|nr:hypothetical protein [Nitrosomonas sp. Is37]MDV6345772.1 hypothetical protein [Nitrosomonas sp. Is37]